ncbi:MAG: hypothetical protein WD871_05130 [Xanthobacteraceae bacterium]
MLLDFIAVLAAAAIAGLCTVCTLGEGTTHAKAITMAAGIGLVLIVAIIAARF